MSNIFEAYSTDSKLEQSGIPVSFGENGTFYVARAGGENSRFQTCMLKTMAPYRRQLELKAKNPDKQTLDLLRKLQIEVYADSIVLGWDEKVCGRDGNPLPFNRDNCVMLLTALPVVFDEIVDKSSNWGSFQADLEADAKN